MPDRISTFSCNYSFHRELLTRVACDDRLLEKFRNIKLLILDVDGVLTDGKIWLTANGEEMKSFHTHDGLGIQSLQRAGILIAIISSRQSVIVEHRMQELGVTHVYQGQASKIAAFETLITKLRLPEDATAYVGDDLPDLPVMTKVGLSIAVNNAVAPVKACADWHTQRNGGEGAVREVCDMILASQNK